MLPMPLMVIESQVRLSEVRVSRSRQRPELSAVLQAGSAGVKTIRRIQSLGPCIAALKAGANSCRNGTSAATAVRGVARLTARTKPGSRNVSRTIRFRSCGFTLVNLPSTFHARRPGCCSRRWLLLRRPPLWHGSRRGLHAQPIPPGLWLRQGMSPRRC